MLYKLGVYKKWMTVKLLKSDCFFVQLNQPAKEKINIFSEVQF